MAEDKSIKQHPKVKDLAGLKFGRLTITAFAGMRYGKSQWVCRCDCGVVIITAARYLKEGSSTSCGCYQRELNTTHGMRHTHEYRSWAHAKGRCFNPRDGSYKDYGGRGITMCEEWRNSFQAFFEHIGPCPEGMSIDRINNDGGYEPGNVRWAPRSIQNRNRTITRYYTHEGQTLTLAEWSEKAGLPYSTLIRRYRGIDKAPMLAPIARRRKRIT